MITCKSEQLEKARLAHPSEPLLCLDTMQVHLPGCQAPLVLSPDRVVEAVEHASTSPFVDPNDEPEQDPE